MKKEFIIYYKHKDYGYNTTTIDGGNITEALLDFCDNYAHEYIYGIMETK